MSFELTEGAQKLKNGIICKLKFFYYSSLLPLYFSNKSKIWYGSKVMSIHHNTSVTACSKRGGAHTSKDENVKGCRDDKLTMLKTEKQV